MTPQTRRSLVRVGVLVPALVVSYVLGAHGVSVVPRLGAALGLALVLIAAAQLWQRRFTD